MTHLEIAKKAVESCGACRAGIPFKMCPRKPDTGWEWFLFHLGFRKRFWIVAHLDLFYCYEHAGVFGCEAMEHIGHLIKGSDDKQNPIFEDGYEDVWDNLTDELDDEEEAKKEGC